MHHFLRDTLSAGRKRGLWVQISMDKLKTAFRRPKKARLVNHAPPVPDAV